MSIREVENFDMEEIFGWICFDRQYALPNSWQETASLMNLIARLKGNNTKPKDFMPVYDYDQSEDEIANTLHGISAFFNKKKKKPEA